VRGRPHSGPAVVTAPIRWRADDSAGHVRALATPWSGEAEGVGQFRRPATEPLQALGRDEKQAR